MRALTKPGRRKPKQDAEPPPPPPSGPTARRAGTAYGSPRSNPDSTPRCLLSLPATGGGKNPTTAALPRARTRRGLCRGGGGTGASAARLRTESGGEGGGGTEGGLLRCLPSCRPREGRAGTPRRATAEAVRHHRHRPGGPAPARRLPRAPAAPGTPLRGTPRSHSAPTAACSVCVYVCVCVRVPPPHRAEEEACERPYPRAALPPATGSSAPTPARKKRTDPAALLPHHHLSPLRSSLGG